MRQIAQTLLVFAAALFMMGGCGDKKAEPGAKANEAAACTQNSDCDRGMVCLAGECADPRINKMPSNPVTPDKVKREVEDIHKRADERNQKALDL